MTSAAALLPPGVSLLERGWLSSNMVVVRGGGRAAVVDSGYWTHADQTLSLVAHAVGADRFDTLVNTHLHSDHCGGNAALQARYPQLTTWIPPGHAAAVRDWDPVTLTYVPTGQFCPPFRFDATLQPGSEIALGSLRWQVHAAPGHDPHSVVLFEPASRTLISADALWENGFGVVFPELEGNDAFEAVASTLTVIERLEPRLVLPGHGRAFTDVAGALDRARSRLDAYLAQPRRHAFHAAKVLLKFKLLELQRVSEQEFSAWAQETPFFRLVHARWCGQMPMEEWLFTLLGELVNSGVAKRDTDFIVNV